MKRTGKRGSGEFEQISWDEAIQTIADKLKYTIDAYGIDHMDGVVAVGVDRVLELVGDGLDGLVPGDLLEFAGAALARAHPVSGIKRHQ